tara:strand:+ start:308 stop:991 length:684 start_codon:yes stop_codon:yes gene_type:complete
MRKNQYATFYNKQIVNDLIEIESCFRLILKDPINPRPWFPLNFMLRAHSAYLAACSLTLAGDCYNSFSLLRNCLECTMYGVYIGGNEERAKTWLERNDSIESYRRMKLEYKISTLSSHLGAISTPLNIWFKSIYEHTIDYGSHPNELGFSSSSKIEQGEGEKKFLTIYLHGDDPALQWGLKMTLHAGLWSLLAFRLIYAAKFELLGVSERLDMLCAKYKASDIPALR